jgi:hypothetical protein
VKRTDYEAPQCAVFSNTELFPLFRSKYSPHLPVFEHLRQQVCVTGHVVIRTCMFYCNASYASAESLVHSETMVITEVL